MWPQNDIFGNTVTIAAVIATCSNGIYAFVSVFDRNRSTYRCSACIASWNWTTGALILRSTHRIAVALIWLGTCWLRWWNVWIGNTSCRWCWLWWWWWWWWRWVTDCATCFISITFLQIDNKKKGNQLSKRH